MKKPPKWVKDYELVKSKNMNETNPQGDALIIPGTYMRSITTTTDHFDSVKQAANQGRLISLKLVWSFRFWKWMYKYTWWY